MLELPRADDDHVGPAIARQLDDRVRGLADRRHVLRFDAEALEHRCGRVQVGGVHLGGVGRVERARARAPDRDVHRRNARDHELGAERPGELGRALQGPLRRLGVVVPHNDRLHRSPPSQERRE